ncbi:MAG: hypothetical protein J6562_02505, partial [Candidatus Schmidhempelia sp.]|nr:hypothetical protein [Candidatus Schmidhempelia sp.]
NTCESVTSIISAVTITFILIIVIVYCIKLVFNYFNHTPKHNLLNFWPNSLIQTSLPKDNYASMLVPNDNVNEDINSNNWKNHLDKTIANIEDNIGIFMHSIGISMLFQPSNMVNESLMLISNNSNLPNINTKNPNISINFNELLMQELSTDNSYHDTFNFTDLR